MRRQRACDDVPWDIVQWVRGVYEPQYAGAAASTHWADGRPTSTEEAWGHYQHDGAVSAALRLG